MRDRLIVAIIATSCLAAPILMMSWLAPGMGTVAVLMPPWLSQQQQLAALAQTGVALRQPGMLPGSWIVEILDGPSGERLARLPALRLPGTAIGCRPAT